MNGRKTKKRKRVIIVFIITLFCFLPFARAKIPDKKSRPECLTVIQTILDEDGNIANFWVQEVRRGPSGKSEVLWIVVCDEKGIPQYFMDENKEIKARYTWDLDEEGIIKGFLIKEVRKNEEGKELVVKSWKYDEKGELEYWTDEEGKMIKPAEEEKASAEEDFFGREPRSLKILSEVGISSQGKVSLPLYYGGLEKKGEREGLKLDASSQKVFSPEESKGVKEEFIARIENQLPRLITALVVMLALVGGLFGFLIYSFKKRR